MFQQPQNLSTATTRSSTSSSTTFSSCSPPSYKTQYCTTTFTRRRLYTITTAPPLLTFLLPPISLFLLEYIDVVLTQGWTVAVVLMTWIICRIVYGGIKRYAPNEKEYCVAVEKCRHRLEVVVVVVLIGFVRMWVRLVGSTYVEEHEEEENWRRMRIGSLSFVQFLSMVAGKGLWMNCLRISLGLGCLSWMVIMRFIGIEGIGTFIY